MGHAVVAGLVHEGARVVACARDPAGAASLPPGVVASVFDDLTRPDAAAGVVAKTVASLGGLDCLIAAAGRGMGGAVEKLTDEQWIQGLEINLLSEIRLARASIEHLRERKGRIVFFTAVAACTLTTGSGAAGAPPEQPARTKTPAKVSAMPARRRSFRSFMPRNSLSQFGV